MFVGLISYSLYLWHWPIFSLARYRGDLTRADKLILLAAMVALPILSWRFVERPFRKRRLASTRRSVAAWAGGGMIVLLAIGAGIYVSRGVPQRLSPTGQRIAETGGLDLTYAHEVATADVPGRLPRLGPATGRDAVLVWGDSHAMALLPAVERAAERAGARAVVCTHSSTPPAVDYVFHHPLSWQEQAVPFNRAVLDYATSGGPRHVLLAADWETHCDNPQFRRALLATVDRMVAAGLTVYAVKDVPVFDFHVPHRLMFQVERGRSADDLALPEAAHAQASAAADTLLAEAATHGVIVIDPLPAFRGPAGRLRAADENGSFYRDNGHLSTYGARRLGPLFDVLFQAP